MPHPDLPSERDGAFTKEETDSIRKYFKNYLIAHETPREVCKDFLKITVIRIKEEWEKIYRTITY